MLKTIYTDFLKQRPAGIKVNQLSSFNADAVVEKWNNKKKAAANRIKPNFPMNLKLELDRCQGRTIIMIPKWKFYKSNESTNMVINAKVVDDHKLI